MSFIKTLKNKLKLWLLTLLLVWFFGLWTTFAADLLDKFMEPSNIQYETTIKVRGGVERVWRRVFENNNLDINVSYDPDEWFDVSAWATPSLIVRATRLLLSLVIALSITMILYNWMKYILDTMNWKDWKSLVKNVIYIAVWIIIALFSVVIITIIQSVPNTLEKWLTTNTSVDEKQAGDKPWKSVKELRYSFIWE